MAEQTAAAARDVRKCIQALFLANNGEPFALSVLGEQQAVLRHRATYAGSSLKDFVVQHASDLATVDIRAVSTTNRARRVLLVPSRTGAASASASASAPAAALATTASTTVSAGARALAVALTAAASVRAGPAGKTPQPRASSTAAVDSHRRSHGPVGPGAQFSASASASAHQQRRPVAQQSSTGPQPSETALSSEEHGRLPGANDMEHVQIVRDVVSATQSLALLWSASPVAVSVDLETVRGWTSLLQLHWSTPQGGPHTLIFDLLDRSSARALVEDSTLADVLRDPGIVKVVHDVREDGLRLRQDFGISITPVFDVQVAHAYIKFHRLLQPKDKIASRVGLNVILSSWAPRINALKDWVKAKMSTTEDLWRARPLSDQMILYAKEDVEPMLSAYWRLRDRLGKQCHIDVVIDLSHTAATFRTTEVTPKSATPAGGNDSGRSRQRPASKVGSKAAVGGRQANGAGPSLGNVTPGQDSDEDSDDSEYDEHDASFWDDGITDDEARGVLHDFYYGWD